jgi:hypothetical protein
MSTTREVGSHQHERFMLTDIQSDILAELELPASGISRHETFETVPLPKGVTLDVLPALGHQDTMLMVYYSAQVSLRKTLNSIHKELYAQECTPPFVFNSCWQGSCVYNSNRDH